MPDLNAALSSLPVESIEVLPIGALEAVVGGVPGNAEQCGGGCGCHPHCGCGCHPHCGCGCHPHCGCGCGGFCGCGFCGGDCDEHHGCGCGGFCGMDDD